MLQQAPAYYKCISHNNLSCNVVCSMCIMHLFSTQQRWSFPLPLLQLVVFYPYGCAPKLTNHLVGSLMLAGLQTTTFLVMQVILFKGCTGATAKLINFGATKAKRKRPYVCSNFRCCRDPISHIASTLSIFIMLLNNN